MLSSSLVISVNRNTSSTISSRTTLQSLTTTVSTRKKSQYCNASGSFPIHLACSRIEGKFDSDEDDWNRLLCVKHLLDTGKTPLTIKDGNRQTILHSAARSGHCQLLRYLMDQWRETTETAGIHFKPHHNVPGRIFDWQDRWYRTPVHWAVLNQRTAALRILLDGGCSAFPSKPKCSVSSQATTVLIERPLEICLRLYGDSAGVGAEISSLLCTHSTNHHFHHCLLLSSSLFLDKL